MPEGISSLSAEARVPGLERAPIGLTGSEAYLESGQRARERGQ